MENASKPQVFLSYASEDAKIASKLAHLLVSRGIDTWWAEWEIRAGQSIRQRIEEGIAQCTHFLVLLTSTSIEKEWVKAELDAGFVRSLGKKCVLIPLRCGLPASALTPLLAGLNSPSIDPASMDIAQLINDIFELSSKPALGAMPDAALHRMSGYSSAASVVAKLFVTQSLNGEHGQPQITTDDLAQQTGLTHDDVTDALHELRGQLQHHVASSLSLVLPLPKLFATWDQNWMDWNPSVDGKRLAADLVNDDNFPSQPIEIARRYDWSPRRLNPAISYLKMHRAIDVLDAMGTSPFVAFRVRRTDETRRFLRRLD